MTHSNSFARADKKKQRKAKRLAQKLAKRQLRPAKARSIPTPAKLRQAPLNTYMAKDASALAQFKLALSNPFSPKAIGVRVVDAYALPSVTYHVRGSFSPTTDVSGTWAGMLLPSPCLSLLRMVGLGSGNLTQFTQNVTAYYASSPTALSNVLTEYRTVAWGIRLVPKDTAFSAKGKYTVAVVPTSRNAPSWNTLETVTAASFDTISYYLAGVNGSGSASQSWVNLPSARVFSAQDLLRGEIQVSGLPYHNSYYEYKGVQDRTNAPWAAGQVLADEGVFNNATGLVNATAGGRKDPASLAGGSAILLSVWGAPASTQEFDIEYIYHLEGTPALVVGGSTLTAGALVPSSMRTVGGSTTLVETALSAAHMAGNVVKFVANAVAPGATTALRFMGDPSVSRLRITA